MRTQHPARFVVHIYSEEYSYILVRKQYYDNEILARDFCQSILGTKNVYQVKLWDLETMKVLLRLKK